MARRPAPPDPELAALARERLARVLGTARPGPAGAARRAVPAVEEEVPVEPPVALGDLDPPRRFTRWHLGVVAVVLAVGLVWGGWSWVRARPEAVAAPSSVPTVAATSGSAAPTAPVSGGPAVTPPPAGGSPAAGLVVHVLGAVRRPGLVRLPTGARVQDAIDAAGGLRGNADPDELNLAQLLDDGVQVVVGTRAHPEGEVRTTGGSSGSGGTGSAGGADSSGSGAGTVDLNRATLDQLDTLPGVGPVTAQKILDWRQQHGRFSKAEELQEVDGIGPKTYARLAPHVRV